MNCVIGRQVRIDRMKYDSGKPGTDRTMTAYTEACAWLSRNRRRWLVTGAAGFIGSNLVERLLALGQDVVGLDNFASGYRHNLDDVRQAVDASAWQGFHFIEADIRDASACGEATRGVDYVLHQAALGSVPQSIEDPSRTNAVNVDGFVNMLLAARAAEVRRVVYASSSAVYGDDATLPKTEDVIGAPLSPYALSKRIDEEYADVFSRVYGADAIGLRYFNVFGKRQDPEGAYAAVIPRWIAAMLEREPVVINGDGQTSRDFCYIGNVVQANVLAALTQDARAANQVYNIAVGVRTTLLELFDSLRSALSQRLRDLAVAPPSHADFRAGDVRHSVADIAKSRRLLGYEPTHGFDDGIAEAIDWYIAQHSR